MLNENMSFSNLLCFKHSCIDDASTVVDDSYYLTIYYYPSKMCFKYKLNQNYILLILFGTRIEMI